MKKGFTLIELLAVIIILAVIALIATPVVLNVVEKAREEAAINSAYGVVDAAKLYYTESLLDSTKTVLAEGNDAKTLSVSGTTISGGTWNFESTSGKITLVDVVLGDYTCNGTVGGMTCTKGSTGGEPQVPTSPFYAFGLPTTSSSTDYQSVITESGSNAFVKLEGEQLSVCIYRNNTLECFKNNNYAEESVHVQNVFGADSCTSDSSRVDCDVGVFNCSVYSGGIVKCYDNASGHRCLVRADGRVSCS